MKVLLVNGSPHANGCTYTALCEVAGALEAQGIETEIFQVGTKPVSGCLGCAACIKTGKCVIDDVVNEFVEKAKILGYTNGWIENAINTMNELNDKYGF